MDLSGKLPPSEGNACRKMEEEADFHPIKYSIQELWKTVIASPKGPKLERAFEIFYRASRATVIRSLARFNLNPEDREEICQDAFFQISRQIGKDQINDPLAWLIKVSKNSSISILKSKYSIIFDKDTETLEDLNVDIDMDLIKQCIMKQFSKFNKQQPRLAEAMILYFFYGKSPELRKVASEAKIKFLQEYASVCADFQKYSK